MGLRKYRQKREFAKTPEPKGGGRHQAGGALRFVVQKHEARRLHYDFRLELGGVLLSWAVPKGPSLNPEDRRLAVRVEDHPLEYRTFEGIIPKGNYGAGTVMVWDEGTYEPVPAGSAQENEATLKTALDKGHLRFVLHGHKLRGRFALVRFDRGKPNEWFLFKARDALASSGDVTAQDRSAATGRNLVEIAAEAPAAGHVWESNRQTQRHGAVPAPPAKGLPRGIKPMLPTPVAKAFDDPDWLFEVQWDGLRALGEVKGGHVKLRSGTGASYERDFGPIVDALGNWGHDAVLDGELVVLDADGRSSAEGLRKYRKSGAGTPTYYVFDLLYLDGADLRRTPLRRRKALLGPLVRDLPGVRYSDHVEGQGVAFARAAADHGLRGVIGKRAESLYQAGKRSRDWVAIKVRGRARKTTMAAGAQAPRPAGKVPLTNLNKVYWPVEGYTKGDLIDYYRETAPFIVPHLDDRPLSLNRHPNGITGKNFFHKDVSELHLPPFVQTVRIQSESRGTKKNQIVCGNAETLLYVANLGCIEMNPWFSLVQALDRPTFLVIDIDPHEAPFADAVAAAQEVHRLLEQAGADCFCKTSGKRGLHVAVPLGARYGFDQAKGFAELVANLVHRRLPSTTSVFRLPSGRRGKIYLDFLQNRRAQTIASPYSVRPWPGATVSTPLKWSEVTKRLDPSRFTIKTMRRRLDKVGDLWRPVLGPGVDLGACLARLGQG
jgi:bifunctional non-homologous end joining protein LigD